ncbi:hypothetical protein FHS85_003370 [Rhodoligotrophos appendicifer]|uniref:diacylglycerol kinase family protein n=1 Tax=Rhodoligotrophos appendicifer TaxID=987056 RepID=UPI001185AFA2|nr:diacylglycerol kinase family protein [Rhodoligotrophos appendicifer]
MSVGLIVNPKARRASAKGLALAHLVAGKRDVHVRVLDSFSELDAVLQDFSIGRVETIFVSSGDGTVQAIQTALGESSPFSALPRLALLPHGTTNMNAADVGLNGLSLERIAALMQAPDLLRRWPSIQKRHTLRVVNPRHRTPQHGMFFGTGALAHAALQTQRQLNNRGVGGHIAPAVTLIRSMSKLLFSKPAPNDISRIDRPHSLDVFGDGELKCSGDQLLLLATTLRKLVLGSTPFWGGRTAPIRTTVIPYPPPNILRHILPIMYGSEAAARPEGCISFGSAVVEIETRAPFLIDGEFFDPPSEEPLRIETGVEFEYLCR